MFLPVWQTAQIFNKRKKFKEREVWRKGFFKTSLSSRLSHRGLPLIQFEPTSRLTRDPAFGKRKTARFSVKNYY